MNKHRAKEWLPLLTAFAEGKQIQMFCQNSKTLKVEWQDTDNIDVVYPVGNYRVAPEVVKVAAYAVVIADTGTVAILYCSERDANLYISSCTANPKNWAVVKLEGSYER